MAPENWKVWMSSFERHRIGLVELPKFQLSMTRDSTKDMMELGIRSPFSSFDSMARLVTEPAGAKLARVLEDATIGVNEKRTVIMTRAVVTGVIGGVEGGSMGQKPPEPFHMVVDHPFAFVMVNEATRAIVYAGVVTEPAASAKPIGQPSPWEIPVKK
jgi:serine protease inhibitor